MTVGQPPSFCCCRQRINQERHTQRGKWARKAALASLQDFARHAFILFVGGGESDESTEIDKKKKKRDDVFASALHCLSFPKSKKYQKERKKTGTTAEE